MISLEINNLNLLYISGIILILLDFIYLYLTREWYKKEIKNSQGTELKLKWNGVIIRYLSQIIGLNLFILQQNNTLFDSFIYGLIIYSNYLGTNYATLNYFDEKLALSDLLKGGLIMVITTILSYKIIF